MIDFDGMIADMLINKKPIPIVIELFIKGRKPKFLFFVTQSNFAVPKNIILNSTHCFILKIPNNQELYLIIH